MPLLKPVRTLILSARELPPDLRAPRLDVLDVLESVDHLAAGEQLAVVLAAVDTRDEAVDASPDVDGIVRDLPEMMTPYASRHLRLPVRGADKARKGPQERLGRSGVRRRRL